MVSVTTNIVISSDNCFELEAYADRYAANADYEWINTDDVLATTFNTHKIFKHRRSGGTVKFMLDCDMPDNTTLNKQED